MSDADEGGPWFDAGDDANGASVLQSCSGGVVGEASVGAAPQSGDSVCDCVFLVSERDDRSGLVLELPTASWTPLALQKCSS